MISYPTGKGMETGPENSPGPTILRFEPNNMLHWVKNDMVQNGLTKS